MNRLWAFCDFVHFLYRCAQVYRACREKNRVHYFAFTQNGVPELTVLIGRDREAWVVTQLALEHQLTSAALNK